MDEAAVAFGGAFGWGGGPGDGAEEFALFGGFAAGFFAGFGFAVEGLCDGGGGALLAEGEDLDVELAGFVFDVEEVADADLAGGFGGLMVGEDALELAGFGGLLAGFEEACGPEPLVDAGAGHAFYFLLRTLDGAEHAAGEREECGDEFERASDDDADETEGKEDEPDEWEEDHGGEGQGPAKKGEETEEEKIEHRVSFPE